MLINPKSLSPVLVIISSMYVPICNRFYATRDNCGKITTFSGGSCLWRPPAPISLKLGGRDLELLKSTLNAENFLRVVLVYLQLFRRNSCVEMCAASKNTLKTPFWGVQDRSRSSMLINLKSLSLVLVMISSMYVPICNRFHIIRANNGKMTSF